MVYGELPLSELEREAFTRGDSFMADVLAQLMDKDEEIAEAEKAHGEEIGELKVELEERDERIRQLEEALDHAYQLVESAARVSDRAAILEALTK